MPGGGMRPAVSARFWAEAAGACSTGLLAVFTLLWPDWIEAVSGVDPDHHSGAVEWAVVGGLATLCLVAALLARLEWLRPLRA